MSVLMRALKKASEESVVRRHDSFPPLRESVRSHAGRSTFHIFLLLLAFLFLLAAGYGLMGLFDDGTAASSPRSVAAARQPPAASGVWWREALARIDGFFLASPPPAVRPAPPSGPRSPATGVEATVDAGPALRLTRRLLPADERHPRWWIPGEGPTGGVALRGHGGRLAGAGGRTAPR